MMQKEIKMTRQPDGKYIVTVDGGSIECATLGAALDILRRESGDAPGSEKWEALCEERDQLNGDLEKLTAAMMEMTDERDRLRKALDSAGQEFEQLRAELEQEKAEKNKWILEAYDWKDTVTKLARHIVRKCG